MGQGIPGTPERGLTVRAQLAVEKAAEETARLRQGYIGTEHLLLGILRQSECGGVMALTELGLEINDIYTDIMAVFGNPGYNGKAQTGTLRSTVRRDGRRQVVAGSRKSLYFNFRRGHLRLDYLESVFPAVVKDAKRYIAVIKHVADF